MTKLSGSRIKDRILSDAAQKAEEIVQEASSRAAEILKEAEARAEEARKLAAELAKREAQKEKERILSLELIEINKKLLISRRKLIDEVFREVEKKIFASNSEIRKKLLTGLIESLVKTGNEEIIVDKELGKEWVERLNREKGWKLKVIDGEDDPDGGFILKKGNMKVVATRSAIMESLREDLEVEVSRILFGK
ncbi:MAG: V-type ATP synthase subunit E [Candidatus Hydrothermae bacterium]|nr:V-type ATP synthase subunit E [Candidatus Hydrothermae bacterium]